jgi:lipoprotein-anchoring transpeptidase ErfK/SrfK
VVRALAAALLAAATVAAVSPAAAARIALPNGSISGWTLVRPRTKSSSHVIAYVKPGAAVALRERPFGPTLENVGATTSFGSPRALSVVRRFRGRWLAVTSPELRKGRVGWVDARLGGLRYAQTNLEITVDLSRRDLLLRRGSAVLRRVRVGVGRSGSPTPTGRFAVTDKLPGAAYNVSYGCCILALSATQTNLPTGWTGGNRIAIHGTGSASDFGRAVSAGCVHAPDDALRYLMRTVPLGTPVVIRP